MDTLYKNSDPPRLAMASRRETGTGCCLRFDPKPWDEKTIVWNDKLFLKDHVTSVFHIPLNFGKIVVKNMAKIQKAKALVKTPLMLTDENSLWGCDVYIAVTKNVPESEMVKISGTFLTKVFEGPFQNIGTWVSEMETFVASKKKIIGKLYFCYTTCPKCAKYYGKNYVVLFAKI
jgi:hypothetical protein